MVPICIRHMGTFRLVIIFKILIWRLRLFVRIFRILLQKMCKECVNPTFRYKTRKKEKRFGVAFLWQKDMYKICPQKRKNNKKAES